MRDQARSIGQLSADSSSAFAIARALAMDPIAYAIRRADLGARPEMINEVLDVMVALADDGMTIDGCHA